MSSPMRRLYKDKRVSLVYKDCDGWWLELKDGWAFDPASPPYGGCHTVSEDTLTELVGHLAEIQKCECAPCLKAKASPALDKAS